MNNISFFSSLIEEKADWPRINFFCKGAIDISLNELTCEQIHFFCPNA